MLCIRTAKDIMATCAHSGRSCQRGMQPISACSSSAAKIVSNTAFAATQSLLAPKHWWGIAWPAF